MTEVAAAHPRRRAGDLRLLGPVIAVWWAEWITPAVGAVPALLMTGLVGLALLVARWILKRRGEPPSTPVVRICWVVLLAVAAGCTSAGWRVAALAAGPWQALAQQRSSVAVVGSVVSDSRRGSAGWGGQPSVSVVVRVDQVRSAAGEWRVRSPVLVLGSGDGWSALRLGERVEVSGSVASMPRTSGLSALLFARGPPTLTAAPAPLNRVAERVRSGLRSAAAGRPPDVAGLLPALVVGDTSALPQGLVDDLRAAGLTHLTAVSGANVAIVLVAVLGAARLLGLRGVALPILGLVAVAGFVMVAHPQPSVLRAAVMGVIGVLGLLATGRRHGVRALLAACGTLLLIDPWLARSWGFALSVAATAGLLAVAPRLRDAWSPPLPRLVAEALAVATAAQVATLPLQVALAGSVGLVGVLANVLAAPAVAPATVLGAAAAVASVGCPPLATAMAWLAGWPVAWIVAVARRSSSAPLPTLHLPPGLAGLLTAGLALWLAVAVGCAVRRLAAPRLRRQLWWRPLAAVLVVVLVVGWWRGPARWPPVGWVMVACDVGQGDALVLNAGAGAAVVVDTGPEPGAVDRCLRRLGISHVPVVVLTHDHADHVEGLPGVLRDREVGLLLVSPLAEPTEQAARVVEWASGAGVPWRPVAAGEQLQVGALHWQVLWPARVIRGEGSDPNNASIVLLVTTAGLRLLLTGDVEPAAQQAILTSGADLQADVFKVPHHGSAAQDADFWRAAESQVAVVSVGADNDYGHPNPQLLSALTAAGISVWRTDTEGDIALVVDGGVLRVVTR